MSKKKKGLNCPNNLIYITTIICIHKLKIHLCDKIHYPAGSYLFKVNKRNTRAMREICSKLKIKTLELEAATRGVLCRKVFLEILQNSQENTYANSLCCKACNFIKKKLWHRCFPVNFWKFLRTPFIKNTSGRLLLQNSVNDSEEAATKGVL